MPGHDLIVIGASAGGVEALSQLVQLLPADLSAAVCVVLHVPPTSTSVLPRILSRKGVLPAAHAVHGETLQPGRIYIAPPDQHLLVKDGSLHLTRGAKENNARPAVDPLFRTAARAYGPRVVGVVLSGALDDGTVGLAAVKRCGGITIVQDPQEALYPGMPRSALENVSVDYCLSVANIAATLVRLASEPSLERGEDCMSDEYLMETHLAELDLAAIEANHRLGAPSRFSCPDCGGVLSELLDGDLLRFRCQVGHAFSPESLLAKQSEALETAFWAAFRALEESAKLNDRLAVRLSDHGHADVASRFRKEAEMARSRAALVRQFLLEGIRNEFVEAEKPSPR